MPISFATAPIEHSARQDWQVMSRYSLPDLFGNQKAIKVSVFGNCLTVMLDLNLER